MLGSLSKAQQWHAMQSQKFKLYKSLQKQFLGLPSVHLRHFRHFKVQPSYKTVLCRSGLSDDAPFAIAVGTCVLNSIVFPPKDNTKDQDGESMEDMRYAAMGIISFIPFFNWLSWVFAWLDTGRQRYLVYAIVYLAPYIRSNLSISPEDSWLPIASILICILHIQLEISLKNGDLQDFQLGDTSVFFTEDGGEKGPQKNLHSLLQKLRASDVEASSKTEESVELPLLEDTGTERELETWDEKMKSLLEDQQPQEENGLREGNISKTRNGLGKNDDSDVF